MRRRAWLALTALVGALAGLIPLAAPAQSRKVRGEQTLNQRLAREAKVSEEQAGRVFKALGPVLREELQKGNTVNLPGLGTMRIVRIAEHKDIEVGTGRPLRVPARNTVEFLASEGLADAANSSNAVPATTIPGFEFVPLPDQTKGQKTGPTRSEGIRTK